MQQNYIRAETLIRANARLVKAQAHIPLTKAWGGGEVASADGLRFVVPVRTLHAGYNSKYFHVERGVTYYNFTSDQFSGFHGIVIPGTLHDSPYVLDGLLEHQTTELQPRQLMTNSAGLFRHRLWTLLATGVSVQSRWPSSERPDSGESIPKRTMVR